MPTIALPRADEREYASASVIWALHRIDPLPDPDPRPETLAKLLIIAQLKNMFADLNARLSMSTHLSANECLLPKMADVDECALRFT